MRSPFFAASISISTSAPKPLILKYRLGAISITEKWLWLKGRVWQTKEHGVRLNYLSRSPPPVAAENGVRPVTSRSEPQSGQNPESAKRNEFEISPELRALGTGTTPYKKPLA